MGHPKNEVAMRILTVNLPHSYIEIIDLLSYGYDALYASRSEFIRQAIREAIITHYQHLTTIAPQSFSATDLMGKLEPVLGKYHIVQKAGREGSQ